MRIRPELPPDRAGIHGVHVAAFGRLAEAELVNELRASGSWIGALSLVAVERNLVVGHVVCSRATIEPGHGRVLVLGPLGVHPDHQRRGIGQALVRAAVSGADALGEPLIALLGTPAFYSRFGFQSASGLGIEPPTPGWRPHFQVRRLASYDPALRGTIRYPEPFDRL